MSLFCLESSERSRFNIVQGGKGEANPPHELHGRDIYFARTGLELSWFATLIWLQYSPNNIATLIYFAASLAFSNLQLAAPSSFLFFRRCPCDSTLRLTSTLPRSTTSAARLKTPASQTFIWSLPRRGRVRTSLDRHWEQWGICSITNDGFSLVHL